jgi:hypothetical protein
MDQSVMSILVHNMEAELIGQGNKIKKVLLIKYLATSEHQTVNSLKNDLSKKGVKKSIN